MAAVWQAQVTLLASDVPLEQHRHRHQRDYAHYRAKASLMLRQLTQTCACCCHVIEQNITKSKLFLAMTELTGAASAN